MQRFFKSEPKVAFVSNRLKNEDRQSYVREWIDSDLREPFIKPQENVLKEHTPILKDGVISSSAPFVHSNPKTHQQRNVHNPLDMEILYKLLSLQSAPDVDIDVFSGDPLEFAYFMATFSEVVEKKVEDQMGRLIRLIKYTAREPKELIKNCIQLPSNSCYNEAKILLMKEYGDPYRISVVFDKSYF